METTENCSSCCNDTEHIRFSFVYVQICISLVLIILMIQFMVSIYQQKQDILKYHDTISSFCACKNDWNNRFLLMFTFMASANLLCPLFEEFNSRNWALIQTNEQDRK